MGWPITHAVGIKPTGWTFEGKTSTNPYTKRSEGNIQIWGLPYSEHSSFTELKSFVQNVKPKNVISTVGSKDIKQTLNYLKQ